MTLSRATLERRQVLVYLAAIGTGLLVGSVSAPAARVAETLIWPAIVLLLYATFTQVTLLHLRSAVADRRFTGAVVFGNFVVLPLAVWALVQLLPADPAVRLGVLLDLLVPCTDWFITFAQLAGGDVPRAIAVTPVNLVLQLLLLPVYLVLMARAQLGGVVDAPHAGTAVLVVALPLLGAAATEWWVERDPLTRGRLRDGLAWGPVPLLAVVVLLIAATQVTAVLGAVRVLPTVVPVFLAFLVVAGVTGVVLTRSLRLPAAQGRTLTFSLATRNSFVVLPFALALPAGLEIAAVVIVVQSLVELFGMVGFLRWVPRVIPDGNS